MDLKPSRPCAVVFNLFSRLQESFTNIKPSWIKASSWTESEQMFAVRGVLSTLWGKASGRWEELGAGLNPVLMIHLCFCLTSCHLHVTQQQKSVDHVTSDAFSWIAAQRSRPPSPSTAAPCLSPVCSSETSVSASGPVPTQSDLPALRCFRGKSLTPPASAELPSKTSKFKT